jgi:hypothetical protein
VYELKRTELLKDAFIWAYERSAARYAAVRQSLGEPDPFRLRHRQTLREVIGEIIRGRMDKKQVAAHAKDWTQAHIDPEEHEQFQETAENEISSLHEGNFARYRSGRLSSRHRGGLEQVTDYPTEFFKSLHAGLSACQLRARWVNGRRVLRLLGDGRYCALAAFTLEASRLSICPLTAP